MEVRYLVQRTDLELRFACNGTAVRFREPPDHFKKRRFAGAVRADQADFFRGVDLEADVSKNVLRSERFRDAIQLYEHVVRVAWGNRPNAVKKAAARSASPTGRSLNKAVYQLRLGRWARR